MSQETMYLSIEGVPADKLPEIEEQVAVKLRDMFGLPQHADPAPELSDATREELKRLGVLDQVRLKKAEKVLTFAELTDTNLSDGYITTRMFDEIVEMSEAFPGVVFRLFAYGDEDGGWPWASWVQNGEEVADWSSNYRCPATLEELRKLDQVSQEPTEVLALVCCLKGILELRTNTPGNRRALAERLDPDNVEEAVENLENGGGWTRSDMYIELVELAGGAK